MFYRRRSILRVRLAQYFALRVALHLGIAWAFAWLALSGPVLAQTTDLRPDLVDNDGNGLIEIYTLEDLNNIRHDLAGTSYKTSPTDTGVTGGCPMINHDNDDETDEIPQCHGYELMNDLNFDTNGDSTVTRTDSGGAYWNDGDGWKPIGTRDDRFAATFEGNSHTIANLYINRSESNNIGLFGLVDSSAVIRNLGVVNANVTGFRDVGGLVGRNLGNIIASYAVATVSGDEDIGGLVGWNFPDGTITASYAVATVSGRVWLGGLVGWDSGGAITASYAMATVSGAENNVGGLVGQTNGRITASYALATVSGNDGVGGLVGASNGGIIRASSAVATVSGNDDVGGLVGDVGGGGSITASYAKATVSGNSSVGGLVGLRNSGTIRASYAVATVSGVDDVGGLAGFAGLGNITASYALATVSGNNSIGGLVGYSVTDITASYSVSIVSGNSNVGGLVGAGLGSGATPDGSYFDATFAGATSLSDSASSRTTSELQTPDDYEDIYMSWNVDVGGVDTEPDDPWDFGSAMQYPALVLPLLATGACPAAISPAVMIEMAAGQCIHRPVSRFASVELDDDRGGHFDGIIFTNKRNPSVTARLLLPVGSTVRVAAGTTEVLMPTQTDANRHVTLTVNLAEGPNVFEAFWVRESGESDGVSLGTLTITLDTTAPTLKVFYREGDGRFYADEVADNLTPAPIIRYARLDRASSDTCTQGHFRDRDLTDLRLYDSNPANAERFLPALVPDGDGNVGVYCFVAEDLAGNRTVESSANAVPAPAALRLKLRVFLESALP